MAAMGAPPPYSPGEAGPPPAGTPYPPPAGAPYPPPAGAPYPPPPGFNPAGAYPPQQGMPQAQYMQQTVVPPAPQTITVTSHQAPMVAIVDQCPNCKIGSLHEQFTPFGILCAIFFFPIGLICCLMSRHKMCPVCGTVFHGR